MNCNFSSQLPLLNDIDLLQHFSDGEGFCTEKPCENNVHELKYLLNMKC